MLIFQKVNKVAIKVQKNTLILEN